MRFVLTIVVALAIGNTALIGQEYQLGKPIIQVKNGPFLKKKALVTIDFRLADSELRFTTDGTEPTTNSSLYKKPIAIKHSSTLKVKAFKSGFLPSELVATQFVKLGQKVKSIKVSPEPSKSYPGNGGSTLIDRSAGSLNFRDGNWLGYNTSPITVTIDLGKEKLIKEILVSTLTSSGSWIMPPTSIQSMFSADGVDFSYSKTLTIDPLKAHASGGKVYYSIKNESGKTRFVKLIIQSLEKLPDWHAGKGNAGWLFLDEIIVN